MLDYYFYKIKSRLASRWRVPFQNPYREPGVLAGSFGQFNFKGRFVFYFLERRLLHLGDELFHQPLIDLLNQAYDVTVATLDDFRKYYTSRGIKTISIEEFQANPPSGAVIISKDELAYQISGLVSSDNFFIGMNYAAMRHEDKVVSAIVRTVRAVLKTLGIMLPLPANESNAPVIPEGLLELYQSASWVKKIPETSGEPFLVYNDSVASNYLDARRRKHLLKNLALEKNKEGYRLIYVGSRQERVAHPTIPSFINLDLRGEMDPSGLFKLFSLPQVKGIVSFDTFPAHVGSLFQKDLYIVVRKASRLEMYRKKYIPMYPGADHIVKVLL